MKRKTKKSSGDRNKRVVVNDRIQKGYCYELSAPVGHAKPSDILWCPPSALIGQNGRIE